MRAGLGGGFSVDLGKVWVGLELICAGCAALFCSNVKVALERGHKPKTCPHEDLSNPKTRSHELGNRMHRWLGMQVGHVKA